MNDKAPIAIIATFIVLFISGGAWWMSRRPAPANATPRAVTATEVPIDKPAPPPIDLPPRDGMDAFLRPCSRRCRRGPSWCVDRHRRSRRPARRGHRTGGRRQFTRARLQGQAGVAVPRQPRRPARDGSGSYRRYDGLAQTVTSIDASAVARIYQTIRPRLSEAYRGMGHADGDIDGAVRKALDILLDTPVVKDPIVLVESGAAGWAYDDDELESLAPTQAVAGGWPGARRCVARVAPRATERVAITNAAPVPGSVPGHESSRTRSR